MPNFLSKFVKPPGHTRDRSNSSRSQTASVKHNSASDTESLAANVTVVPPSPFISTDNEKEQVGSSKKALSRPSSSHSLASRKSNKQADLPPLPTSPAETLATPTQMRHQTSNKSLRSIVTTTSPPTSAHLRAATTPDSRHAQEDDKSPISMTPITESPTALISPEFPSIVNGSTAKSLSLFPPRDSDAISIASASPSMTPSKDKKRPWKRSNPTSKPSGLASAIATSGLTMANPGASAAQLSPPAASLSAVSLGRRPSVPPVMNRTPSGNLVIRKNGGRRGVSPRSSKKRSKAGSPPRRTSISVHSDANSEYFADESQLPPPGVTDYYSGLEDDSSEESDADSSGRDDLMDLDLEENAVTGFAVASHKRNSDFHELFHNVPETDYLIEDYGCALQREILIQGRLYISENHICFHANIFGWITDLSIPIAEIEGLERKMTAFVIPNAIQITTRQAKYSFASFLSRDTTFDVIYNIWRLVRPNADSVSPRVSIDVPTGISGESSTAIITGIKPKKTQCACLNDGSHFSETMLDTVIPGTPDRIYNLIFTSGFIKEFYSVNQKLLDIQISDWAPISPTSSLLTRNMSYIKPLNGSVGPKQTKCEIKDETVHLDFEEYVSTITTTRTPDVPSGGVFAVMTRTCIMWATAVSTRVIVTTQVDWSGRSFIKGIIERSALEGQKGYHVDLEKAMRAYIQEHQSEFIPEGVDVSAISSSSLPPLITTPSVTTPPLDEDSGKQRERERNQRAFQWAYDTFNGASQVAVRSTKGALELVKDAWDQSGMNTTLYFVIVGLVLSNAYTYFRMQGTTTQYQYPPPTYPYQQYMEQQQRGGGEDREKWIHGVVAALWDELASGKSLVSPHHATTPESISASHSENPREEAVAIHKMLDDIEERVRRLRRELMLVNAEGQVDSLD